mmetsp:Transcript_15910/g.44010  ORF Transcript_15910/g.44010 Transcript_15910/m.44010 type:complete len:374 (-) Transcript_15910:678-1799(-)
MGNPTNGECRSMKKETQFIPKLQPKLSMPLLLRRPLESLLIQILIYPSLLSVRVISFVGLSPRFVPFCGRTRRASLSLSHAKKANSIKHSNSCKMTASIVEEKRTSNDATSIKAILFDMDGTLLDTETLADKAILMALFGGVPKSCLSTSFGSQPESDWKLPWEVKKQILGLRGKEWAPICLNFGRQHTENPLPTVDELIDLWEKNLNGMCAEIEACEGAKALVEGIVSYCSFSNSKIPLAIATSSRMSGVNKKRIRHERDLFEHIDAIVTGDDPAVKNGKPAPDIYLEAARRLNVDPTECLVFEDALSGVKSGKAAGCKVVAIPDARFSDEERAQFSESGADVVLRSLWEFDGHQFGMDFDMNELKQREVEQ